LYQVLAMGQHSGTTLRLIRSYLVDLDVQTRLQ